MVQTRLYLDKIWARQQTTRIAHLYPIVLNQSITEPLCKGGEATSSIDFEVPDSLCTNCLALSQAEHKRLSIYS